VANKIVLEVTDQLLRDLCKNFLSYAKTAEELKIKRPSVYYFVNKYKLTPYMISGTCYLSRENVEMIKKGMNHRKRSSNGRKVPRIKTPEG
jgi:hypothetical protein